MTCAVVPYCCDLEETICVSLCFSLTLGLIRHDVMWKTHHSDFNGELSSLSCPISFHLFSVAAASSHPKMEQWDSVILHSSVTPSRLHSKGPTVPDSWANVPPNYHGYRLGSILRYPDEISHFMSFLQDKGAR